MSPKININASFGESLFIAQLGVLNIDQISNNQFPPPGCSFHPSSISF